MSKEQDRSDEERRKRLAAALRDNLKRRKAQDRARREAAGGDAGQPREEPREETKESGRDT